MEERRLFGLRRNVFFLGLVSLFNDFSNEMIQSVMPAFLALTLGVSAAGIGLIEGGADALASFLKIFSGWFSDKTKLRKLPAVFGYSLSVSTRPFYLLVHSFSQVLSLRLVDRTGKGIRDAPRDALLAESANHKELGKSFGYHRAMDSLGATLGPLFAFLIFSLIGLNYPKLFIIAFFIGLFSILSFLFVKEIKPKAEIAKPKLNIGFLRENRRFSLVLLAIFIFGLGTLPIILMLLRPVELGITLANLPLVYFLYNIVFVLTAIPFGRLSDRIGERNVISFGFLSAIITYLVLLFSNSITAAIIAFIFFGLFSATTDGIERALAAKLVAHEVLATGQGLLNAAVGISSLLAGAIGGFLWTKFSAEAAFIYGASFSFLGLLVFLLISFRAKVN